MRRFLLGFLVALALAIPVTLIAAPPKVVNVQNPMVSDLNANGYRILNSGDFSSPFGARMEMNAQGELSLISAPAATVGIYPDGAGTPSMLLHGDTGNIEIGAGRDGYIRIWRGLPAVDPHNNGQLWNDAGTLKVSSG